MAPLAYPVRCNVCGFRGEEDAFNRGSLDAYADLSVDYDLFCPACESDDVTAERPLEDKYEE